MIGNSERRRDRAQSRPDHGPRANIQGISVGSTQMFEALNRAIAANGIKPVIDKVFGFDDVKAAYQHMAARARTSARSSSAWADVSAAVEQLAHRADGERDHVNPDDDRAEPEHGAAERLAGGLHLAERHRTR